MAVLRRNRALTFILVVSLTLASCPVSAFAAETYGTPKKEMTVNEQKFYDIYDGSTTGRADTDDELKLLSDALTKKGLLSKWAGLAYTVYKDNPGSYRDNTSNSFDETFGRGYYFDLVDALQRAYPKTSMKSGSPDKFMSTGLTTANNLQEVEMEMGDIIAKAIDQKLKKEDFVSHSPIEALHNDKQQTVFYSLAGFADKSSLEYYYTCFGLVFYDFKLTPLIDDEPYDTAIGDMPFDEAVEKQEQIRDFKYIDNSKPSNVVAQENNTSEPATLSYTSGKSTTTTASTTITNTDSYTYTEALSVGAIAAVKFGSVNTTATFTAAQLLSTAYSDQKTISETDDNQVSSTITAPPYTGVSISSSEGKSTMEVGYDCPVGISYRTLIVSMNGKCYDDGIWNQQFKTAGYSQNSFYSLFGSDYDNGDSITNLYDRALRSGGYENTHGKTVGNKYYDKKVETVFATKLNWDSIFKQGAPASKAYPNLGTPKTIVTNMTAAKPMSITGAILSEIVDYMNNTLEGLVALHPLRIIKPADESLRYDLEVGKALNLNTINLSALNSYNGPYYGFDKAFGSWKLVDENKKPLSEDIAKLETDSLTKNTTLTATGPGKGYITYEINEDTYTYSTNNTNNKYTKNSEVTPPFIQFTVQGAPVKPFEGTVEVTGEITLTVGEDAKNINEIDTISYAVYDETDKEIEAEVVWESRERPDKGIQVDNNTIRVTKAGAFHVRPVYQGVYSEWAPVTALPDTSGMDKANLSRDDLSLILFKIAGLHGLTGYEGFIDADPLDIDMAVYKEAVKWAKQKGIINGEKVDEFEAGTLVTKEQFVTIIYRFANYMGIDTTVAPDAETIEMIMEKGVSPWAVKAYEWALSKGWITEADLDSLHDYVTLDDFEGVPLPIEDIPDGESDAIENDAIENDEIENDAIENGETENGEAENGDSIQDDGETEADSVQ